MRLVLVERPDSILSYFVRVQASLLFCKTSYCVRVKTPRPVAGVSQDCDSVCSALGRTCNSQACTSSPGCREWEGLATRHWNWKCVPPSGPPQFSGHMNDQTVWTCSNTKNCKLVFLIGSLFQGFYFSPKPFRMISGTKAKLSGTDHNFSGTARL